MARVVVIGSINDDVVVTADRLPGPGETVAGTTVTRSSGGKGANQAIAAARAGADVAMVGAVGADEAGDRLLGGLVSAGVDVADVAIVDGPTGTAVVTVAGGENTIVVVPGANGSVSAAALSSASTDLAEDDVVVAQLETPAAATTAAFSSARAAGAVTILNPAPASSVPSALVDLADHLVVNEHEVELVLGVAAGDLVADRGDARARLRAVTEATVHLTLGADGVLVLAPDVVVVVRGRPVEVVDPTGAGDCYVGTLAASLVAGSTLLEAVRQANIAASISVTRMGATPSMPTKPEVDAALSS